MNLIKRFLPAALLPALMGGAAVSASPAASAATVRPAAVGVCEAIAPGFMGSQEADNGQILAIGPGFLSPVVAVGANDFNSLFGPTCFKQTHLAGVGNPLIIDWRPGRTAFMAPDQYVTNVGGHLMLEPTVTPGAKWIFNEDTNQQVNGGYAINLSGGVASLVPAATTLAGTTSANRVNFDPAS